MTILTAFAAAALLAASTAELSDIDVARSALRDGLWSIARQRAAAAGGEEAERIICESYAREGKWDDLLVALPAAPGREWRECYRALALHERGESDAALSIAEKTEFKDPDSIRFAALLAARIRLFAKGDAAGARALLEKSSVSPEDDETRLLFAEIHSALGESSKAQSIWRGIVVSTSATERVVCEAAVRLRDIPVLESLVASVQGASNLASVSLALAKALMERASGDDLKRAEELVRGRVSHSPDVHGAREAMISLASRKNAAGDPAGAMKMFDEAFSIWPALANDCEARFGRADTMVALGREADACNEYSAALECATNDEQRAYALLCRGDACSRLGRQAKAMESYREAVEKYPSTKAASSIREAMKVRELVKSGDDAFRQFKFDAAESTYAKASSLDATLAPALEYRRALCRYARGLDEDAERLMRALVARENGGATSHLALLWLAKYSYNRHRRDEARKLFLEYADSSADGASRADALFWAARCAFDASDFEETVRIVTRIVDSGETRPEAFLLQADALLELARFDEAVLVLERLVASENVDGDIKTRASLRKADALFAMGADNPARYREALEAYRTLRHGEAVDPSVKISLSYKIARTLEKLKLYDEAFERYYAEVLLAYWDGRRSGVNFSDEAKAVFSRAAFRLADEYEGRGRNFQAMHILDLVATADVPAAAEAKRRLRLIKAKGAFL